MIEEEQGEVRKVKESNMAIEVVKEEIRQTWTMALEECQGI
jgi:hypothetical protein